MTIDFLAHLRAESARFGDVLRDSHPAARVPTCPDWSADDLLYHLAEVFDFWGTIVRERLDTAYEGTPERPAEHAGVVALYVDRAANLIDTLEATPDDVAVWSWSHDHTVGFVRRRMAHEALIHRLDAELTAGAATDVDAALATDGVHEVLQHFHGGAPEWSTYEPSGPVGLLHTVDTGGEWLVQLGGFSGLSPNTGKSYDDQPCLQLVAAGEASFTVGATARDLDAWLWNRPPLVAPVVEGDRAGYESFAALVAADIQ